MIDMSVIYSWNNSEDRGDVILWKLSNEMKLQQDILICTNG